jgi:hypothetical protein
MAMQTIFSRISFEIRQRADLGKGPSGISIRFKNTRYCRVYSCGRVNGSVPGFPTEDSQALSFRKWL